jgi:hypothetical protein
MKVRCKKVYTEQGEMSEIGSRSERLTVGKEYIVLTIYAYGKEMDFQFEGDDGDLIMFDAEQFEQTSQHIPSNWELEFKTYEDGTHYLSLAPEAWNKARYPSGNGFYEEIIEKNGPLENWRGDPSEQIPEVVKLYLQETEIIYSEEERYGKEMGKDAIVKQDKFTLYNFIKDI